MKTTLKNVIISLLLVTTIDLCAQVSVASAKNKVVSNLVESYLIGPNIILVNDSEHIARFDTINIDTAICDNDVYYYDNKGDYISLQGKYQIVYENITGGDSVININLKVNPTFLENYCWELVEGESLEVDDKILTVPGSYIFKYQSINGCDSTIVYNISYGAETKEVDCIKTYIDTTSSLNDVQQETIKIYPNPTTDIVYIDNLPNNSTIELYNTSGMLIKKSNNKDILNMSELETGVYYIRIINDNNKNITKKIIKK